MLTVGERPLPSSQLTFKSDRSCLLLCNESCLRHVAEGDVVLGAVPGEAVGDQPTRFVQRPRQLSLEAPP